MTVDEKREKLNCYCGSTKCEDCLLKGYPWTVSISDYDCLSIDTSSEDELDRALQLIGKAPAATGGHIVEIPAGEVLDRLKAGEDVYIYTSSNEDNYAVRRLKCFTVGTIMKFTQDKDAIFFVIKSN